MNTWTNRSGISFCVSVAQGSVPFIIEVYKWSFNDTVKQGAMEFDRGARVRLPARHFNSEVCCQMICVVKINEKVF